MGGSVIVLLTEEPATLKRFYENFSHIGHIPGVNDNCALPKLPLKLVPWPPHKDTDSVPEEMELE